MAFPADDTPFVHLGPEGDTRGIQRFLPGQTIREGDLEAIITNTHRAWSCAHRAAYRVAYFQTTDTSYTEAARVPLSRVDDRDSWVVSVDKASCEVRATLKKVSDGSTVGSATETSDGATRTAPSLLSLSTTEATSVALYVLLEVKALSGTGALYGGQVVEGAAST